MMLLLKCGAPHPDPKRPSDTCGSLMNAIPKVVGEIIFAGTVKRIPDDPDGKIYAVCPRCKAVNKFIFVAPARTLATDADVALLQKTS